MTPASKTVPLISKEHWLLGSVPYFRSRPTDFLLEKMQQYGEIYQLRIPFRPIISLHNPDHIKYVLVTNNKNYRKDFATRQLSLALGNGLLTSEGEFWRRQRRIAQPAFHRERIAGMFGKMLKGTETLLNRWEKMEKPINLSKEMMIFTSDVAAATLFGTDLEDKAKVGETLLEAMRFITHSFRAIFPAPLWVPTARNRSFLKARQYMDFRIQGMIDQRRETDQPARYDLLAMLMEAEDEETGERMTDQQLRDEVITIFSAGHETSANSLTWTFYLLDQHPEIRDRLEAEVESVLAGRMPAMEDLKELPYVMQVIQESMRLYPPAWVVGREALADDVIGEYHVAKGTQVLMAPFALHRNPAHWPDPDRFDPDRFLPEAVKARHRHAYLPFGGGPRFCIGNNFALMEMQLLIAAVVQRFRLSHVPGHRVALDPLITLRPKYGMEMRLEER